MISFFRRFFESKIGLPIVLLFLVVIAIAFTAGDVTGTGTTSLSGGDQVAVVGNDRISASELDSSVKSAVDQVRRQDPTLTMASFVDQGGFDEVLDQLVNRYAIGAYAEKYGLRAGDNLVNSEILQLPGFRGPTGEFDQAAYEDALQRQRITEAMLRRDLSDGLLAQQMLVPALAAPQVPEKAAKQYAALVLERRQGKIALVSSLGFVPEGEPTEEELAQYYSDNRTSYVIPERRTLRYAVFNVESVVGSSEPTPEEVAARYELDADQYAEVERRATTSFVVPTEEAARAFAERINGGLSLEAAAAEAGFNVSRSELRDREQTSSAVSFAFMEAVFAADEGALVEPARSTLGWYVARVDSIEFTQARTLEEATPDIVQILTGEKSALALAELSASIEDELADGTSLNEVAEGYDLDVVTTPPVLADGTIFGAPPGSRLPPVLAPTLEEAFLMDESEPQLGEVIPGVQYLVFDVEEITEADAPELSLIRDRVATQWKLSEGAITAREVADRVLESTRSGTELGAALDAEGGNFQIEAVDLERRQLLSQVGRNIPTPLVLLFSMAENSTKLLEAPNDLGWYVVDLDAITTLPIEDGDPLLARTQQQFAPAVAQEYTEQLTRAIRAEMGVELDDEAIEALRSQLTGQLGG